MTNTSPDQRTRHIRRRRRHTIAALATLPLAVLSGWALPPLLNVAAVAFFWCLFSAAYHDGWLDRDRPDAASEGDPLALIGVRQFGGRDKPPIILADQAACGSLLGHIRRRCIRLTWVTGPDRYGWLHLTITDARRLADQLHAMTDTNGDTR